MGVSRTKITSVVVIVFLVVVALLPLSPVRATGATSLTPDDIRTAYDVNALIQAGYTGRGVTVAIIGYGTGPTFYSDQKAFSREYGLPPPSISWIAPFGTEGTQLTNLPGSGSGEITGDAELVHAMAPDAKILLVLAGGRFLDGSPYVIDQNAADVVTSSYGVALRDSLQTQSYNDEYAKAVSEHITLIAASGDTGANNSFGLCANLLPDCYLMPTYSPWITIVGGTELQLNPYSEVGWIGSSGGVSNLFPEPAWQKGLGVPQNGRRNIPDIALAACGPAYAFYYNNSQSTFCGASGAAPTFAGIVADIDQAAGGRVGFLNPILYSVAAFHPSVFHAITTGCSKVKISSGTGVGYCAHPGWNFVAGWGSIDAARLALYFAPSASIIPIPVPEFPAGEPALFALTLFIALAILVSKNRNRKFRS